MKSTLFQYAIHFADNALILGQRNSEWTGHGPVLEQDIAITNISLDLLGQARNFYQYAAVLYNNMDAKEKQEVDFLLPRLWKTYNRELNEDDLAFLRDERQYLNLLITELPKEDWAQTVLRQFLFSSFQYLLYTAMEKSNNAQLSAIAEKSLKEVTYHLRWSGEWIIRLGDGTKESNTRINKALQNLWPFTGEFFNPMDFEQQSVSNGFGVDVQLLKDDWFKKLAGVFEESTLEIPVNGWMQQGGKEGKHTEHLGYLLTEMQYLQRAYPNVSW
jgi:ring-1,2-phenylacetyl-CoA epoxidase subunit PaaC